MATLSMLFLPKNLYTFLLNFNKPLPFFDESYKKLKKKNVQRNPSSLYANEYIKSLLTAIKLQFFFNTLSITLAITNG